MITAASRTSPIGTAKTAMGPSARILPGRATRPEDGPVRWPGSAVLATGSPYRRVGTAPGDRSGRHHAGALRRGRCVVGGARSARCRRRRRRDRPRAPASRPAVPRRRAPCRLPRAPGLVRARPAHSRRPSTPPPGHAGRPIPRPTATRSRPSPGWAAAGSSCPCRSALTATCSPNDWRGSGSRSAGGWCRSPTGRTSPCATSRPASWSTRSDRTTRATWPVARPTTCDGPWCGVPARWADRRPRCSPASSSVTTGTSRRPPPTTSAPPASPTCWRSRDRTWRSCSSWPGPSSGASCSAPGSSLFSASAASSRC